LLGTPSGGGAPLGDHPVTDQPDQAESGWKTLSVCDPTPEQFNALDADTIARENGALRAWLNPVSSWTFDRLDVREAGDDKTFGDITGTWMGVGAEATMMQATAGPSAG